MTAGFMALARQYEDQKAECEFAALSLPPPPPPPPPPVEFDYYDFEPERDITAWEFAEIIRCTVPHPRTGYRYFIIEHGARVDPEIRRHFRKREGKPEKW